MKPYQVQTSVTPLSSQNCKLRPLKEVSTGKEINFSHLNHPLPLRQINFGTAYMEAHLFTQIPKMQNSLHSMGIRIRGLTIKGAFNQYNLTS